MTTCYIIRHAERELGDFFNPGLRIHDNPITTRGQQDALRLADYLCARPITVLYASQYLRAQQTIAPAAERMNLDPCVDQRLNEINNGRFGMLSEEDIQRQFPEEYAAMIGRTADFRFPGGETGEEARARLASFLDDMLLAHPQGEIAAVCHEGLIRTLMCHIMGLPVYKRGNFKVDFCGITEIHWQPNYGAWKLVRFNQAVL